MLDGRLGYYWTCEGYADQQRDLEPHLFKMHLSGLMRPQQGRVTKEGSTLDRTATCTRTLFYWFGCGPGGLMNEAVKGVFPFIEDTYHASSDCGDEHVYTKRLPAHKDLFTGRKFGPELDE